MFYAGRSKEEIFRDLDTGNEGIDSSEIKERLEKYGRNEITKKKKRSPIVLFLQQFRSFIIYVLIAATIVSLLVGEYLDSIVILAILIFNAVLGFIQEYKAEKSIEALQKLAGLKAKVIRDGKKIKVDASELVPGDLVLVETGDKIPADARLVEATKLQVNEASLTGESACVEKNIKPVKEGTPVADQKDMLFSGTVVTRGKGSAIVVSTGMDTQIGKIAKMIQQADEFKTPLQEKLDHLGQFLGYAVIIICIIVFFLGLLRDLSLMSQLSQLDGLDSYLHLFSSMKDIFMTAIALAVAAVPEGLAAVVTVSLALGVQRMIKRNALIRRLPSVETLGSTTVICTDKTGTLTRNQMTVRKLYTNGRHIDVTGAGYDLKGEFLDDGKSVETKQLELLLSIGALNNDAEITEGDVIGDPTEGCLIVSAAKAGIDKESLVKKYPRMDELEFDSERKMMSTLHKMDKKKIMYVKGAPDVVLSKSSKIIVDGKVKNLEAADKKKIKQANQEFAEDALRVLAFAYKETDKIDEKDLVFVGLQAMIDPPRHEAKEAVKKCKDASIKVVMITGDHKVTAEAIGREIGIKGRAVSGDELDKIDLEKEVEDISIYARVNPKHKMSIVNALKDKGHIVAMTGDGVNDAPALKHSDIGVSMGITGTDVAKEASDMILTDDNFASIVGAVEQGRGIEDNIKKFVNYLLSSNMAEVLVIFVAMIIGFRFGGEIIVPLLAVQLLWINLVTDGLPALALGVDPIAKDTMKRPPRNTKDKILSHNMVLNVVVIGVMLCAFSLWLFKFGLAESPEKARTLVFTALVVFEIVRIYMIRSQYKIGLFSNIYLWLAIGLSMCLQLLVVYLPFMQKLFETVPLSLIEWAYILGSAAVMLVIGLVVSPLISWVTKERD